MPSNILNTGIARRIPPPVSKFCGRTPVYTVFVRFPHEYGQPFPFCRQPFGRRNPRAIPSLPAFLFRAGVGMGRLRGVLTAEETGVSDIHRLSSE